jgi:hypothetical protein
MRSEIYIMYLKFMVHCGHSVAFSFVWGSRCRRISSEHPSTVLEKFVEFLEDALEDDSDSDEDE